MENYVRFANFLDAKTLGYIHCQSWKSAYKTIIPDSILDDISVEKRERYFRKALTEKSEEDALIFITILLESRNRY
jgi:hypothetical protein